MMPASWRVFCILFVMSAPVHAATPKVVASIKPVHALVAGVMKDVATPAILIPGAGSVHTYSLRPSDAETLDNADVVFWIGPSFERFLTKPLTTLAGKARVVPLMAAPNVRTLQAREGGLWEAHADDKADEHAAAGHDDETDGHIWLDPGNAKAMVIEIARVLGKVDIANASRYAANAAVLLQRIDDLDGELRGIVAPIRDRPFVVFHDAYQYFERHFGVMAVGSITVAADRPPGARRVAAIRAKVVGHDAICVFAEPQFEPKLIQTLVEGTSARIGTLDPEGSTLTPGEAAYFTLMRALATDLARCLGG